MVRDRLLLLPTAKNRKKKWANKYFGTRIVNTEFSMQSLHHYTLSYNQNKQQQKSVDQMKRRQQWQQYLEVTDGNEEEEEEVEEVEKELKTTMTSFSFIDNWHINLYCIYQAKIWRHQQ